MLIAASVAFGCGFVPLPDGLVGGLAQSAGPTQPPHDLDHISTKPIVLLCLLKGVIDFLAVGFGPFYVAPGDDDENRSPSTFVAPAVFRNHTKPVVQPVGIAGFPVGGAVCRKHQDVEASLGTQEEAVRGVKFILTSEIPHAQFDLGEFGPMVLRQRVRRFGIVDMFGGLQCRIVMSNALPFKKTQSKLGFADAPLSDQQQLDLG